MHRCQPEETLLEHRETPSFPDQHIWDLTDLNTDEKHGVARVLLVQPLGEGLEAQGSEVIDKDHSWEHGDEEEFTQPTHSCP